LTGSIGQVEASPVAIWCIGALSGYTSRDGDTRLCDARSLAAADISFLYWDDVQGCGWTRSLADLTAPFQPDEPKPVSVAPAAFVAIAAAWSTAPPFFGWRRNEPLGGSFFWQPL